MSTPDCGIHCKPPSSLYPYGKCCSCRYCHGKPVRHAILGVFRAVLEAAVLVAAATLIIAAEQALAHHVLR